MGLLAADLHDGSAQNGIVVAADLSKDSMHFHQVRETLDQHERVVLLASLESPVADRLAGRLSHDRPPRTAPGRA
jgi:hypothetical protein